MSRTMTLHKNQDSVRFTFYDIETTSVESNDPDRLEKVLSYIGQDLDFDVAYKVSEMMAIVIYTLLTRDAIYD